MNFNIYWKEWKRYRMGLVLWATILSLLIILTMIFYPTIVENAAQLESILQSPMMGSMMEMFGGGDASTFVDILGFYATKNISFILLLGSIFSIILASTIIAREENEKTAEFLLTKPVNRTEVFNSKVAVWLSLLVVLNLIITGLGYLTLEIFKDEAPQKFNLTQDTKTQLITGLRNNPGNIHQVFQLNDQMFDALMIRQLEAEMKSQQAGIEKVGISQQTMEELLSEFSQGPQYLFQQIRSNPDKYMRMLNIPAEQKDKFLKEFAASEKNYQNLKAGFKNDPEVFIQFFEKDPEYFMQKYAKDREGLQIAINQFGWDKRMVENAYYAYDKKDFFILSFYCFLLMLVFGAIGLLASILIRRGRPISNIAVGVVLAAYVIDAASKLSDKLEYIGYISPFKFVNINVLEAGYGLEPWRMAYLILVPLLLIVVALSIYQKKDIII